MAFLTKQKVSRPPLFWFCKFQVVKKQMKMYIKAQDYQLWRNIINGTIVIPSKPLMDYTPEVIKAIILMQKQ